MPRSSAVMGHERKIALNGDHIDIVKYCSAQNSNFESVAGALSVLIQKTTGTTTSGHELVGQSRTPMD